MCVCEPFGAPVVPDVKQRPQGAVSSNSPQGTSTRSCAISGSRAHTVDAQGIAATTFAGASISNSRSTDGAASAIFRAKAPGPR